MPVSGALAVTVMAFWGRAHPRRHGQQRHGNGHGQRRDLSAGVGRQASLARKTATCGKFCGDANQKLHNIVILQSVT